MDALLPGIFNQVDYLGHPAPEFLIGNFQVDDIDGNAGLFPDRDRLRDGIEHSLAFVAIVSRIDTAETSDDTAEFHDVIGIRQRPRRHREHARQSIRSVLHRLFERPLHRVHLLHGGAREGTAHGRIPDVVETHIGGDIHSRAVCFQCRKIVGQCTKARTGFRRAFRLARVRRGRIAFAQHFGCHPLPDLAGGTSVFE